MTIKFRSINKYAVAISYGDKNLRLVTRQRRYSESAKTDNYVYQLSTYNEINEGVCTEDTLGSLLILMDNIKNQGLFGSGGQLIERGYVLIPVMLNINVTDSTPAICAANLDLKREKILAKLTKEDKLILGITD